MKILKTPLRVERGSTMGVPRIVDVNGKPVCSFGNQARHRGYDWAWKVANEIVEAVNEREVILCGIEPTRFS